MLDMDHEGEGPLRAVPTRPDLPILEVVRLLLVSEIQSKEAAVLASGVVSGR